MMANNAPTAITTNSGDVAWQWIGVQGQQDATPVLLVIHVMPNYQKGVPS
jgi:hypothetical protein